MTTLFDSLTLPNGQRIANRLAKAAMEENMADGNNAPSEALTALYRTWAEGGAGLLITGNVMVDRRAMTNAGGVVVDAQAPAEAFQRWAQAARSHGAQVWMQINHPGRQMPANLGQATVAPSEVAMDLGSFSRQFAPPRAMTEADILEVRDRFVQAARRAEAFGFTGVQIHAAHGYLLSQFLSPLTNRRTDAWGGSLEKRARLLLDIVKGVRAAVRPDFAVAVKLNSADFQRGGFSPEDAQAVVALLNPLGVDLLELSGGSYEAPAMHGQARDGRTLAREAYFLSFAQEMTRVAQMPLMVTGGIRRAPVAQQVLDSGVALVGMATALALEPALPALWQRGEATAPALGPITLKNKVLASVAYMAMVKHQFRRHSRRRTANPTVAPMRALLEEQVDKAWRTWRYRRVMSRRPTAP